MKTTTTWIQQADDAMKRAAKRARDIAARTNTPVHVISIRPVNPILPEGEADDRIGGCD